MARNKNIKEVCLQELACRYPGTVGAYDAKKKELKAPDGQTLALELGKIGRSEAVYVVGAIREFLRGLDLVELQPESTSCVKGAGSSGRKSVSLSDVPARQAISARSWGAWFKVNCQADPEAIRKAVKAGYAKAEEAIEQAREAEALASQKAMEDEALKTLQELKKNLTSEQLAELLKRS